MLLRYCDDQFDPESSTATIGIDFKVSQDSTCAADTSNWFSQWTQMKRLVVRGKAYRLNIFDTVSMIPALIKITRDLVSLRRIRLTYTAPFSVTLGWSGEVSNLVNKLLSWCPWRYSCL